MTWDDFTRGARHILAVSDSIGDGWSLRGSLVRIFQLYIIFLTSRSRAILFVSLNDLLL